MGLSGAQWNSVDFSGRQCDSVQFSGFEWDSVDLNVVRCLWPVLGKTAAGVILSLCPVPAFDRSQLNVRSMSSPCLKPQQA